MTVKVLITVHAEYLNSHWLSGPYENGKLSPYLEFNEAETKQIFDDGMENGFYACLQHLASIFSILFMMVHINSPFHLTAHQRTLNPFSFGMNAK